MSLSRAERAALNYASRPPGSPTLWHAIGTALRGLGRVIDQFGLGLQGSAGHSEKLPIPTTGVKVSGKAPAVVGASFVAPSANLTGAVHLGQGASVWYSSMLKGDVSAVEIGELSSVGDRAIVTASTVGRGVNIGAGALVTSAKVGDNCSVGMGAKVLKGASLGTGSMLAAGSVLPAGTFVPSGQLWAGNPAKWVGEVGADQLQGLESTAALTAELASLHAAEAWKDYALVEEEAGDYKRQMHRTPDYISYLREDPKWVPMPTLGEYLTKIGAHSQKFTPP